MEDRSHSRTILIVDDHQGLISLIQRCLSREGFHTAFAHSGEEALTWLSHHHADLLLLDLQLADMPARRSSPPSQTTRSHSPVYRRHWSRRRTSCR